MTAGLGEAVTGGDPDLLALWNQVTAEVTAAFRFAGWADAEITAAQDRHPGAADLLYHATPLLGLRRFGTATMEVEFVYRGHCREILDRLAAGEDTRPATDAEICMVCSEMSLQAPLVSAAAGLYFAAWLRAFPDHPVWDGQDAEVQHYKRMDGYAMRDMERATRRKAAAPGRVLPKDLACNGDHAGAIVDCRFVPATLDGLPAPARKPRRKPAPPPSRAPGPVTPDPDGEGDALALF